MGHTGIFATLAECTAAAGENVDVTGFTETNINAWCAQIESEVNLRCRYNFSDNYADLNEDVKRILSSIEASFVAIMAVTYNMSGFTTRIEAEDMINVHRDNMLRQMKLLSDMKTREYMKNA